MSAGEGARAQRKRLTRQAIIDVATGMFLEHGFEQVSVADIAAAARVSKMTVFNYFDVKEELILSQLQLRPDEPAQAVRTRGPQLSPLAALQRSFLGQLRDQVPASGLNQDPRIAAVWQLIDSTESLTARLGTHTAYTESRLAAALTEVPAATPLTARIAANQVVGITRALVAQNVRLAAAGADPDRLGKQAIGDAAAAFAALAGGLGLGPFGPLTLAAETPATDLPATEALALADGATRLDA
ncbi:MAG TPA: helix-turn-helix domain-containing protein [Jatrophihabitans sp.]|nr:helix-turn-helix domain-containing protein [Jatrophihabitans sp.]